jgi:lipopolysaccharide/colanic/teichoic acid biosynthesis glycosyltransferase
MLKRITDILLSFFGIIFLSPLFLFISIRIRMDSKGGILYRQLRVGKGGKDFRLLKFRTMFFDSDKKGLLTVGTNDSRITKVGQFLRDYKLDELPQLINVFIGDMSLVGPRPEVRKYVDLYSQEQLKVLSIRPGITDYASIQYSNENELLGKIADPENVYINEIMPAKLTLNLQYIHNKSFMTDLKIILATIGKIFGNKS